MKYMVKFILPFVLGVALTSVFFVRGIYSVHHSAIIGQLRTGQAYIDNANNPDMQPQKVYDSLVACYLREARWIADTFWLAETGPELMIQHKAWQRVRWLRENLSTDELVKNSCLNQLQGVKEKGANMIVIREN